MKSTVLTGRVRPDGTAWLPVEIIGERIFRLQALVDTGFDDYLSLPGHLRRQARLRPVGYHLFELADGRVIRARIYLGRIRFAGESLDVPVVLSRSEEAIIGVALFRRRRLTIRYRRRTILLEPDPE